MSLSKLLEEEVRILKAIESNCKDPKDISAPIPDGIVNPEVYLSNERLKIMWILKEPYCDGETGTGGGWSMVKKLNDEADRMSRQRAFQPICYINFGIWNGTHDWDEMPWLRDSEEIRNGLRRIAYINVGKLPGFKFSPNDRIVEAYKSNRNLILHQIKTYDPDIIFACNPHATLILSDLCTEARIEEVHWKWYGSAATVRFKNRRLIMVGHPSSRTNRRRYVNDAIQAAISE